MRPLARLLLAITFAAAPVVALAANCRATVLTSLAFGSYDPFSSTPLDTAAQLELRCSAKATAQVSLSEGGSGTFAVRELRSGSGGVLQYNIYLDASRQTVWSTTNVHFSTERSEIVPMFGRIFPRQLSAPAGTYADTLTLTVSY